MTPKSRDFSEKCSLQAICSIWAALPGAQHLERCFAPKDVFHMTRRAFLVLEYLLYIIQRQRVLYQNLIFLGNLHFSQKHRNLGKSMKTNGF